MDEENLSRKKRRETWGEKGKKRMKKKKGYLFCVGNNKVINSIFEQRCH